MVEYRTDTTVAAIATPEGNAALGVVRLTGPHAWDIAARCTHRVKEFAAFTPGTAHRVDVLDAQKRVIDQTVVLPWKNPRSFTGEDLVEFITHGGHVVVRSVYERVLEAGAAPAGPGEFSYRAFLNGKMSLDQAEAVASLIEARTQRAARASADILSGGVQNRVNGIRDHLAGIINRIEVSLDFVEEDYALVSDEDVRAQVEQTAVSVRGLLNQYRAGRFFREGATVIIAGSPNAGKSTLLNTLLGYERAIVSDIPGTTRDYLDAAYDLEGIPVRLFDTAGLRDQPGDVVEAEGTIRAKGLLKRADAVIWLVSPPDFILPDSAFAEDERLFIVRNKLDLPDVSEDDHHLASCRYQISATTGEGIEQLLEGLASHLLGDFQPDDVIVMESRQAHHLQNCIDNLEQALVSTNNRLGLEFIVSDLRTALNELGYITGALTSHDLLNRLFASFCIGK